MVGSELESLWDKSSRYEPGQIFIQWMKIPAIGHHDRGDPSSDTAE